MSWRTLALAAVLAAALVATCSAQQSVTAQEILSMVTEGQPVYYDGIAISGDLNLSRLPAAHKPVSIQSSFVLINCTIPDASFAGITFAQDAIFWGSSFGNASFKEATFLSRADFSHAAFQKSSFAGCTFNQPAFFNGALFQDNLSFENAAFSLDTFFKAARFLGSANFNYSKFNSYSYFAAAEFSGDAFFADVDFSAASDFSAATFFKEAIFIRSRLTEPYFGGVHFFGPVQFGLAHFTGLSSFGEAVFGGEAGFALARFSDAVYFSGASFQELALFGLARFEDIVTFQEARFGGNINFKGATVSSLLFDTAELEEDSKIILNDSDIRQFHVHWKKIRDHVAWHPGAYLALVENYRRLGWSEDEDECYYHYRRLNQLDKSWGWSKIIDVLAWVSCGYGVRPSHTVVWSLFTILAFGLIFWKGDGIRRSSRPLDWQEEQDSFPERVTLRNALFFSTMIFLSQGPIDFLPVRRHRYYVILEGILGWLLLALFLVTLGRVMIR